MLEVAGGTVWVKTNLKVIHFQEDLKAIMDFGNLWRGRGHNPLVHVISPSMNDSWINHKDPSGLRDNVPSHIDLFIVDFYNRVTPEIPDDWSVLGLTWKLWEYESGKVRFDGTLDQFYKYFGAIPEAPIEEPGGTTPDPIGDYYDVIVRIPKAMVK